MLVIAHRGASGTRPENTLAAFRRAVELGAPMIELDVQLTRDREVVVMHDWTLDRTTDARGPVRERTLAELRRLDAGGWFGDAFRGEPIPTLQQVLAGVPAAINVELKPVGEDGLEACALAVVESAGALGRVVFSSFDPTVLERLRAISRTATLAVLWETEAIPEAASLAKRVAARALHLRKEATTAKALATAAAEGLTVRVWTVNHPDEIRGLEGVGLEGVFTDFPERFLHRVGDE